MRNDTIQSVLHAVGQVIGGLADDIHAIVQHLSHVLQGRLVALTSFVRLRTTNEGLDIVGFVFEDSGGVADDAVEVGQLLVAGGAVAVALQCQVAGLMKNIYKHK